MLSGHNTTITSTENKGTATTEAEEGELDEVEESMEEDVAEVVAGIDHGDKASVISMQT